MQLTEILEDVSRQAESDFASLSFLQLNWKPDPSRWSIAQCLDHLIVSNTSYFPSFDKLVDGSYRLSLLQKMNPFKKALGPLMVKSMGPQPVKKFRAPKIFEPAASDIPADIVNRFLLHQQKLKDYFARLQKLDMDRLVIASPANGFITYGLSDALKIIARHEQRHLNQAMQILNHPNFPPS